VSSRQARATSGPGVRSQQAARVAAEQAAQRRRDRNLLVVAVTVLVVLVVGGGVGLQLWRTHRLPVVAVPTVLVDDAPQSLTNGRPIRLGSAAAPVTVQLYEDFHCPHCVDFADELGPTLTAAEAAGTVRVELYPMAFVDAGSGPAANAMACATEAGFGARYHHGLFANHSLLWNDRQLLDLAGKVGASADETFATCVATDAKAGWLAAINTAADRNGVTQTPTMFLDGAPVDPGSLTPESLQSMIDMKR
jgi:protein-disulfide isomerase